MIPEPVLRLAEKADVPAIVTLLRDDTLGKSRESAPDDPVYGEAFELVSRDANNQFYVVDCNGSVIGYAQLTFVPGLARRAAIRAIIEAVRISSRHRGQGLGHFLIHELIRRARERGCTLVQLTSDKSRKDAHRFYEDLGFENSHEGFKMALSDM